MKKSILVAAIAFLLAYSPNLHAWECQPGHGCTTIVTAADVSCVLAGCLKTPLKPATASLSVTISGTFTATFVFEQSSDYAATWTAATGYPQPSGAGATGATGEGLWIFPIAGRTHFRVRPTVYSDGSATVTIVETSAGSIGAVTGSSPIVATSGPTPALSCPTCATTDGANAFTLTNSFYRIKSAGTALEAADFALSAGWGDTPAASISAVVGTDQATAFTVSAGTANFAANPTITLTFKDGTWTDNPVCVVNRGDASAPTTGFAFNTTSATALVITFQGTPQATTYKFNAVCMGR